MSRKIKIQTVDKAKSTELENTLKENLIQNPQQKDNNPCKKNIWDAFAYTNNNDNSIILNIEDIKLKKCIDKFKDIILDVTTDDFTDNMSINEKIIKTSRRDGIILEEDFQNFLDVINIEKFDEITDIPEDVSKLTVKLHGNKKYLNNNNVFLDLTGYYNFLINKLFIPIENITKNSYFFKLADKYISNYNKFEFNIPNENIDNFAQSASTNYKDIMSKINSTPEENMDILTPENNPCNMTENSNTYEEVNHPDHYNVYDVEVVDMMERIFGIEETMSWCKLNAFKYRMRAGEKPTSTVEKDLKKEKWCLNKYKELKSKK